MKKILFTAFCLVSMYSFAQRDNRFVLLSSGWAIGGPSASLSRQMKEQGFDDDLTTLVLFAFNVNHPHVVKYPSLDLRFGGKINNKRSFYVVADFSAGEVEGFQKEGDVSFILIGGSYGKLVKVRYQMWQLGGGYLYAMPNSRWQLGLIPSVYYMPYSVKSDNGQEKHSALVPGASFTTRLPLGPQKRQVGVDLITDINLAPPAKIQANKTVANGFRPGKASMVHGLIGIALSVRK